MLFATPRITCHAAIIIRNVGRLGVLLPGLAVRRRRVDFLGFILAVTGERGTAIWRAPDASYVDQIVQGPKQESKRMKDTIRIESMPSWQGQYGHNGCLDEMFAARAKSRPAETDCRDNINSLQMVLGAIESSRTGQKVWLVKTEGITDNQSNSVERVSS